jgi:hypothetical protein
MKAVWNFPSENVLKQSSRGRKEIKTVDEANEARHNVHFAHTAPVRWEAEGGCCSTLSTKL